DLKRKYILKLLLVSLLLNWRIWYVDNQTVITGGLAWVGVWRVCFNSHILDSTEICKSISLTDSFTPPEIAAAQVLCMVAVGVGVLAILVAGHVVRNAIFGVNNRHVRLTFVMAGSLFWLTAACSLVPVFWNMNSVLANLTIDFPPDFYLPSAPVKQEVAFDSPLRTFFHPPKLLTSPCLQSGSALQISLWCYI
uniref:Claudin 34 n=1 Tax=Sinocyclocheilus anshuiensis TaxID=1608454 RepID=A0A671LPP5_9TELE